MYATTSPIVDLHKFVQLSFRVLSQLGVTPLLHNHPTSQVDNLVKLLQEGDTVGDENASLSREEAIRADNLVLMEVS